MPTHISKTMRCTKGTGSPEFSLAGTTLGKKQCQRAYGRKDTPQKRQRALEMVKAIFWWAVVAQLGPKREHCQPQALIALHAVLEDRKTDGGGKGENKISHKLAVTVIDGTGNEETGTRVQQKQMWEPGMGLYKCHGWRGLQSLTQTCCHPPTQTHKYTSQNHSHCVSLISGVSQPYELCLNPVLM